MKRFPLPARAVMIDLDGTLVDTVLDIAVAANAMMKDLGLPALETDAVRSYVGRGVANLVKRCLAGRLDAADDPSPPPAEALASFKLHYGRVNGVQARLYPGALEGVKLLHSRGLRLACITNKGESFTLPLMERTGLAPWFEITVSGDSLPRSKPDPMPLLHVCERFGVLPGECVFIGDSVNDVRAARAAGTAIFCVPYGYNEGEDPAGLNCDAIVATVEEAANLIQVVPS